MIVLLLGVKVFIPAEDCCCGTATSTRAQKRVKVSTKTDGLPYHRPFTYCTQPLVQLAQAPAREALLVDPRLTAVFMAASSPVAGGDEPKAPAATPSQVLSGPQAADIVWALGLLQWCPPGGGGRRRLTQLVELVAQTASSKRGIEEGYITNVLWSLERLDISSPPARVVETTEATMGEESLGAADVGVDSAGEAGDAAWEGSRAVRELRRRVDGLPFRAIPSLFKVRL